MTMGQLIKWFQLNFPDMVKAMKESDHHFDEKNINPYHIEGDVFTHTMMVCKQAENENFRVQVAALLHDVGKPMCRETKGIKTRFFGHEGASTFVAMDVLIQLGAEGYINESDMEWILQLIATHTDPFKLSEEKVKERFQGHPALLKDLYALNRCDQDGRFHGHESRVESSGTYMVQQPKHFEQECMVLIGLPYSGKSTFAQQIHMPVLSRDDIVMELGSTDNYNECFKEVDGKKVDTIFNQRKQALIREKKSFVVDRTNLSRKSRRKILGQLPSTYKKTAIVFIPSMEVLELRKKLRKDKIINNDVMESMMRRFYPPLWDEFDEVTWRLA